MTDFIRKHGSEVRNMLFTEFNMDDAIEVWMEEGWTKGHSDGLIQGRSEGESLKLIQMVCKKLKKANHRPGSLRIWKRAGRRFWPSAGPPGLLHRIMMPSPFFRLWLRILHRNRCPEIGQTGSVTCVYCL